MLVPPAHAWAIALSCYVPAQAVLAQDAIPSVEIAGARYDQRREDTASSVVVGREQLLRHGDRSLGDALKRVVGITIGGSGRATDIRLRGLGSGYTQVLLDGVAAPNGFSLESLSPDLIERVEVVRTASAELGTQSIAGTINIVLRRAASAARTSLKIGVDRQRGPWSGTASGEAGSQGAGYSYAVPVTLTRSRIATLQTEDEQGPGLHRFSVQPEINAATNLALSPRASWRLDGGDQLTLRGLINAARRNIDLSATETALDGATTRYPARASLFLSRALWLRADGGWSRSLEGGARIEARAGLEASRRDSDFEFGPTVNGMRVPVHFVRADFRDSGYRAGTTWTGTARGGHTLSAGWDGARDQRRQVRLGRDLDAPGVALLLRDDSYRGAIDRVGVFVQDAWAFDQALSLSLGWRAESLATTVRDSHSPTVRQRSLIASPLLQALYKAGKGMQLRAGLTRTYKAPTMGTLIPRRYAVDNNNSASNPDTEGNPALRPEKAWGLDLGVDQYFGKDSMLGMSGYVRRIEDVTVARLFQQGATWVSTPDNQGRASTHGLALEAKLVLPGLARLAFNANLARNWSSVERIAGPDNRLAAQTPLNANMGIEYRGALRAGASLAYTRGALSRMSGAWTAWNGGTRALDVYALWGTGSSMRVRLAATNLLERDGLSGARYDDGRSGGGQTVFRTSNGAALKLTLERDL